MSLFPLYGAVVGLALGLTGGGGSILAVPLLMYALGLPLRDAVMVSLLVVGGTALFGAVLQRKLAVWRAGLVLSVGGLAGAPVGAWLGSRLPEPVVLGLLAALMAVLGIRLWRGRHATEVPLGFWACRREPDGVLRFHWPCAGKLGLAGGLTGLLAGVFGVGGGFLLVPALIWVAALPMERALPSSLVGIAGISAAAFISNSAHIDSFPWVQASLFLLGSLGGMLAGTWIKTRLSNQLLQQGFALVLVGVALWMGYQALFR